MEYGKVISPIVPLAVLPFTGNNKMVLIIALSMVAVGVVVLVLSVLIARKKNLTEIDFSEVK